MIRNFLFRSQPGGAGETATQKKKKKKKQLQPVWADYISGKGIRAIQIRLAGRLKVNRVLTFADDGLIYKTAVTAVQEQLEKVSHWCQETG